MRHPLSIPAHKAARDWRQAIGVSVTELAAVTGIRRTMLSEWFSGKRRFSENATGRVIRALLAASARKREETIIRTMDGAPEAALLRAGLNLDDIEAREFAAALGTERSAHLVLAYQQAAQNVEQTQ